MQDATIAILAMGGFGLAYGALALWQAKVAQRRIAALRAEEQTLSAVKNSEKSSQRLSATLAAMNSSVVLSERKPTFSVQNVVEIASLMTLPRGEKWAIRFSEGDYSPSKKIEPKLES